ncbi:MAG: DUF4990 domain-containing protein [Paludibacteraceae bacterium]|nr:DUF4990 domain-containing protein [Paludibacteraceae bacterium]
MSAATYYASPNGSGNGSSYATPTSFANGLKKLSNPGDTLYLLSGQYDLGNTSIQNLSGTASRHIVISGYEGIQNGTYPAILDFRTTPYGTRGLQIKSSCTYVHIKNLTLRWSGKNNLYNEGSYCLFENLDIYGSSDTGCQMKVGGNNTIRNVDSHDNFDYEHLNSSGQADFGGNADGFADKQFTGAGNHYIGCRAWNNSDDGWDFFQRVSTSNTVIENCICFQNGPAYYDLTNNPRVTGVDKAWFTSKVGTTMTDRYGQTITIVINRYPCQGNGNGFKMGGGYTDHKILIHHSLAVGNYARGFDQNNNGGTMWVYNCSAFQNVYNYGFTTAYGTNTIQNCISLQSQNSDSYKSQTVVTIDHNSWNNGFSVSASDFLSLDTTQILAARQADGSLPVMSFMHLRSTSSLIDAGIDVNLSYNGAAPDLGCYETDGETHDPEPQDTVPATQPEGTHSVAFVSIPNAAEDKPLLQYLRQNDSLWITVTDATDASIDYSSYEVVVLGSKPASSAAGFTPLKSLDKPMVLLKPWLLKPGVWSWGTAINTQDLSVNVANATHPLFSGLTITDGQLQLFSQCNQNAVTAISAWTLPEGEALTLASPVSQPTASSVAILPTGMIMIGVSEYSTLYLSEDAKKLIENAILYQLGITMPTTGLEPITNHQSPITNKLLQDGQIIILRGAEKYTVTGQRIR